MNTGKTHATRRQFLGALSAAAMMAAVPTPRTRADEPRRKTLVSFYCDDTSPYVAGSQAFRTFLDYCAEHRIAGESSAILAVDGQCAVYDLMPNAMDWFGIWENNPARVNPDYYISADGKSGIVVRHVQAAAPYCIWYAHWQGLNPAKGVGWSAFTTVVERIHKHLRDQVVWMRPSDITQRYHAAGGWDFLNTELHPLDGK